MSRERLVVISNPGRCSLLPLIIKVRLHRERWVYQNLRLPSVVGQYGIVMSPHASLIVIVPFDESTAVFLYRLSVVKGWGMCSCRSTLSRILWVPLPSWLRTTLLWYMSLNRFPDILILLESGFHVSTSPTSWVGHVSPEVIVMITVWLLWVQGVHYVRYCYYYMAHDLSRVAILIVSCRVSTSSIMSCSNSLSRNLATSTWYLRNVEWLDRLILLRLIILCCLLCSWEVSILLYHGTVATYLFLVRVKHLHRRYALLSCLPLRCLKLAIWPYMKRCWPILLLFHIEIWYSPIII